MESTLFNIRAIGMLALSVILLGSLVGIPAAQAASNLSTVSWYSASSQLKSNNLNDIVMNDNQVYVAVGDEGTLLTSTDARTWRSAKFATMNNLKIAVTNGKSFVVAGDRTIISSKDGVNWSNVKWSKDYTIQELVSPADKKELDRDYTIDWKTKLPISSVSIESMMWDGKRFVATGYWLTNTGKIKTNVKDSSSTAFISSSFVMTSADGLAWSLKKADVAGSKLLFTGTKYVAMGDNYPVKISTDLTTWKTYSPKAINKRTTFFFRDAIYHNGKFIAIGWDAGISAQTGVVFTSTDGINWKEESTSSLRGQRLNTIFWDGKQYWIGGEQGMLLRSSNGKDWEQWKSGMDNLWDDKEFAGEYASINKIIFDGKRYVLAGNRGTIIISDKMYSAEIVRQRLGTDYLHITYDGKDRYAAVGDMGAIIESQNGYDWQPAYLGQHEESHFYWTGVAAGKGVVLALGHNQYGFYIDDERYLYSPSPGEWEWREFPIGLRGPDGIEYRDGKFFVYSNNGYITSTDGIKWSKLVTLKPPMRKIVANGKVQIGLTATWLDDTSTVRNSDELYTSANGVRWSKVETGQKNNKVSFYGEDIIWTGKQFLGVGLANPSQAKNENAVFTSSDGASWKYKQTPARFESITCGGATCIATSEDGNLYSSNGDLMSFSVSPRPTKHGMKTVLWDGEKFIALGQSGTILVSKKPVKASEPSEVTSKRFNIKVDPNASLEEQKEVEKNDEFRTEAEKRVDTVKQIGSANGYEPFVEEGFNEWKCSLNYTESLTYQTFRSGEYRNKITSPVFFNGIDRKQLNTAKEIISAHTGASQDDVLKAIQAIVDGNAATEGITKFGNVEIKYSLTIKQDENGIGELEIWY